ncbi:Uncharacterized protein family (UPF0261) [Teratosphaeria destructans]|uniref:Uncharacterized protein family (UPF0261) n=1 Tax=Teratosphaeria destructans TaxID=418781 RepID=A0A9W7SK99_9PEZI|nr:Uncharacterized protein family (UPF0261) [Teratosphaeria destructans]
MPRIVLLGTADSKLEELLFLRARILESGGRQCSITFVDVGRSNVENEHIDVSQKTLTTHYAPQEDASQDVSTLARGDVIKHMIACASHWLREAYQEGLREPSKAVHGVISAGGTGGTSLASGVMRDTLPLGLPKLIVSTNASGDTRPVVGETDITMMPSVCDIAGLNHLLRQILTNAAGAIAGMATAYERSTTTAADAQQQQQQRQQRKKRVGLTMFGVTTPCVDKIRSHLESRYAIETFVFHCTGAGGRALERLVAADSLDAVLDVTTTEICDHGIPCVISVGATDMVNFGPRATVPERYRGRRLWEHNPVTTLMRTTPEECRAVGDFLVEKIRRCARETAKVQVVLPRGGVSMMAVPGAPFYDAEADAALFSSIRDGLEGSDVSVVEDQRAINDEAFAVDLAERLVDIMGIRRK